LQTANPAPAPGQSACPLPASRRTKIIYGCRSRLTTLFAESGQIPSPESDLRQFPLLTIVTAAVLEEGFFRGVLLRTALLPQSLVVATALVCFTVVAFSVAHVFFGWEHVLAKTPLGIAAACSVLALGSLLPAVVAHVWFNVSVWRDMTRLSRRGR